MPEVLVPPLGQTVDTVTLVRWYRQEGDAVQEGEPLFAIETDKAILDIEAQATGVLGQVSAGAGETVQVLSPIAFIAAPGEQLASPSQASTTGAPQPVLGQVQAQARPSSGTTAPAQRIFISPRARRLAEGEGIAWAGLAGSGPEGAIVERDVRRALEQRAPQVTALPPAATVSLPLEAERVPMAGIRAVIAERMQRSATTAAAVTQIRETDATELVALRQELGQGGLTVSYNDLFLYILGRALREQPELNASLVGDAIHRWSQVHVGLAVQTERGLLVPVVHDADHKGLAQLAQETCDLIQRARAGALRPDEMQGGTFTLTNLGMFGVDAFTPIINLPETAILGVGRIKASPTAQDGRIAIRETLWLSLTFDHRVADGAPAARFLQRVAQLVEYPLLMLA